MTLEASTAAMNNEARGVEAAAHRVPTHPSSQLVEDDNIGTATLKQLGYRPAEMIELGFTPAQVCARCGA